MIWDTNDFESPDDLANHLQKKVHETGAVEFAKQLDPARTILTEMSIPCEQCKRLYMPEDMHVMHNEGLVLCPPCWRDFNNL